MLRPGPSDRDCYLPSVSSAFCALDRMPSGSPIALACCGRKDRWYGCVRCACKHASTGRRGTPKSAPKNTAIMVPYTQPRLVTQGRCVPGNDAHIRLSLCVAPPSNFASQIHPLTRTCRIQKLPLLRTAPRSSPTGMAGR